MKFNLFGYEIIIRKAEKKPRRRLVNKPKARKKWTKEEVEALKQMREEGKTISEIAERLGRSKKAVELRLAHIDDELPAITRRRKWDIEEILELKELYRKGLNVKDISKKLNRPIASVDGKIKQLKKKGIL